MFIISLLLALGTAVFAPEGLCRAALLILPVMRPRNRSPGNKNVRHCNADSKKLEHGDSISYALLTSFLGCIVGG